MRINTQTIEILEIRNRNNRNTMAPNEYAISQIGMDKGMIHIF